MADQEQATRRLLGTPRATMMDNTTMLQYQGNAETIHFVNFVLYSGHAEPAKLVRSARKGVKEIDDPCVTEEESLAGLLEAALIEWVAEFVPANYYYDVAHGFPDRPDSYHGRDAHCLLAPLLDRAIAEIDLHMAARLILKQVQK